MQQLMDILRSEDRGMAVELMALQNTTTSHGPQMSNTENNSDLSLAGLHGTAMCMIKTLTPSANKRCRTYVSLVAAEAMGPARLQAKIYISAH